MSVRLPLGIGNALGNSIVDGMAPQDVPSAGVTRSGLNLDADIEAGIDSTRARNEAELLGMAAPTLDNNPGGVINPGFTLTPDQQRNAGSNQPDPVAVMELQQALAREESELYGGSNPVGQGSGAYYNKDGALVIEITRGANDLPLNARESAGMLAAGRESMRDYWTAAQDSADSFLGYAGAGAMRFLGDVGYGAAEMGAAIYNDPQGALAGAGKALVNFGPESFNALTNLTKTSLNGWTMLAEATVAPQGTFAGFRESDPYNIELLAPYANRAEAGGALLANLGLGVGLAKYGNVSLQSPVYLDLQQGAVAYSGIPIGVRSPFAATGEAKFLSQGFNADQAKYLAQPYEGLGHHFFRREWNLPEVITESPLSILKPNGISRGDFYELHYKVDPTFYGARFPRSIGGSWKGQSLGLEKYGTVGRLWYGSPTPLKVTVGASAAAGGGAAYWYSNGNNE